MSNPKKPASIRKLEGNRGHRPIPQEIATVGRPEPPTWLTQKQRDRWDEIVASLLHLTAADQQVCERMAVAWATFRQTCQLINQSSLLTRGRDDEPVRNPLLSVRRQAAQEMETCGMALGLSPLARMRLTAPDQDEDDLLSRLLMTSSSSLRPSRNN